MAAPVSPAISGVVDAATARILKREVSDGVIAAGYDADALEILKSKVGCWRGRLMTCYLSAQPSHPVPSAASHEACTLHACGAVGHAGCSSVPPCAWPAHVLAGVPFDPFSAAVATALRPHQRPHPRSRHC